MLFCIIFNSLIAECRNTVYSFYINIRPFISWFNKIIESIFVVEHLQLTSYISYKTPNINISIATANRDNRYVPQRGSWMVFYYFK